MNKVWESSFGKSRLRRFAYFSSFSERCFHIASPIIVVSLNLLLHCVQKASMEASFTDFRKVILSFMYKYVINNANAVRKVWTPVIGFFSIPVCDPRTFLSTSVVGLKKSIYHLHYSRELPFARYNLLVFLWNHQKWIERLILYRRQVKFPKRAYMAGWSCINTKEIGEWRLRNPPLMESTIIKFSADFFAPENESNFLPVAKIIFQLSLSVNRNRILIKKNDKSRQCTDYSEASLIFLWFN